MSECVFLEIFYIFWLCDYVCELVCYPRKFYFLVVWLCVWGSVWSWKILLFSGCVIMSVSECIILWYYFHFLVIWLCLWVSVWQGWEFARQFFKRINRFLWAKEQIVHENERITPVTLLSWATRANCSWLLFCKEQWEQFPHSCSFLKSNESELLLSLF